MSIASVSTLTDLQTGRAGFDNNASKVTGQLQNMVVEVDDPLADLTDSAEELTFSRDNSRATKLADRKQKSSEALSEENLRRIKKALETVMQSDEAKGNALRAMLQRFKQGDADADVILSALRQSGGHCASWYALLLNAADEEDFPEFKQKLTDAAAKLYAQNKSDIDAVLNSLGAIEDETFAHPLAISESYAELAAQSTDPEQILAFIEQKFGKSSIGAGMDAMFKALAADLSAAEPSRDTELLNNLAGYLTKTRILYSSIGQTENLVDRLSSVHSLKTGNLTGADMLHRMLELSKSRFVTTMQVHALYSSDVKPKDPEQAVLVGQEILKLVRTLPIEVFDSLEGRNHLLDGVQKHVDELIDAEDAWLESGGNP